MDFDWRKRISVMPFFSQAIAASRSVSSSVAPIEVKAYRVFDYADLDGSGTSDWDSIFSSSEGTSTNYFNVGLPAYSAGDYCVICLANDEQTATFVMTAAPVGWTRLTPATTAYGSSTSQCEFAMWGRLMDGTEGSSVNMNGATSDSSSRQDGVTFTLANVDSSNPVDVLGSTTISSGATTSIPAVTSVDGGLCFTFVAFDGSDGDPFVTSSSGNITYDYEIDFDSNGTQAFGVSGTIMVGSIPASTSTGSVSVDFSSTDAYVAGHVILKQSL